MLKYLFRIYLFLIFKYYIRNILRRQISLIKSLVEHIYFIIYQHNLNSNIIFDFIKLH